MTRHLQCCLLAVPPVYLVCVINTLEINCVPTRWPYFVLPLLFEEISPVCVMILSFFSLSVSLFLKHRRKAFWLLLFQGCCQSS